jgi:hypothetical protein
MLLDHPLLRRGVVGGAPQRTETYRFCPPPSELFHHMQMSFVDRQYSPSTGIDQSEWEIILMELTRMGYIVKKEPESDGGEWWNLFFRYCCRVL